MTTSPNNKPVTLEKRKNLLYNQKKRRSLSTIVGWSLSALLIGLVIAYLLKGLIGIEIG